MKKTIYVSSSEYTQIRWLAASLVSGKSRLAATARQLLGELERAAVVAPHEMPPRVVRIESRVEFEDVETGERETYTLVYPDHADADQQRLSVLAPIGTALLGYSEGDEIDWETPGGVRRIRICSVTNPAPGSAPAAPRAAAQTAAV